MGLKESYHRYRECIKKTISSRNLKHPLLGIHKNRFLVTNSYYDILTPCLRSSSCTFLMSTVWVSTPSFSSKETVRRVFLPSFSEITHTFVQNQLDFGTDKNRSLCNFLQFYSTAYNAHCTKTNTKKEYSCTVQKCVYTLLYISKVWWHYATLFDIYYI